MLTIENLCVIRDNIALIDKLNLQLDYGEMLYINGCNGIGKTSLLHTITGLNQSFTGSVNWNSQDCYADHYEYQNSIDFLGHKSGLKAEINAVANLTWRKKLYLTTFDKNKLFAALKAMDVTHLADIPCGYLSAGQLRKVALASILFNNTTLWILDEPFTALDQKGITNFYKILDNHLTNNGMVIISSHMPLKKLAFTVKTINLEEYSPDTVESCLKNIHHWI